MPKPSNSSLAYISAPKIIVPSPTKTLIQRRWRAQFIFLPSKILSGSMIQQVVSPTAEPSSM